MRKKKILTSIAALLPLTLVLSLSATPILAGEKVNHASETKASGKAVADQQQLSLAAQLAKYGYDSSDPLALITAARIMKGVSVSEAQLDKSTSGEGGEQDEKTGSNDMSVDGLLAKAAKLAGEDEAMQRMIAEVAAPAQSLSKGDVDGPGCGTTRVNSNSTDRYSITFQGGRSAVVGISGDGDTDLDLSVFDENGNSICTSSGYSDDEACDWNPRSTGAFRIEVKNLGNVYNEYLFCTN